MSELELLLTFPPGSKVYTTGPPWRHLTGKIGTVVSITSGLLAVVFADSGHSGSWLLFPHEIEPIESITPNTAEE